VNSYHRQFVAIIKNVGFPFSHCDIGDDLLSGGFGNDQLTGGLGMDTFVLTAGENQDMIQDFSLGEGDKLGLTNGVTFNDLFFQGNEIRYNGQTLAMLNGIDMSTLTEDAFVSI
ncbi:MAG: hypothetical protein RLP02_31370, partial [Coleofasciculus sp. C2-GNP5-27]